METNVCGQISYNISSIKSVSRKITCVANEKNLKIPVAYQFRFSEEVGFGSGYLIFHESQDNS